MSSYVHVFIKRMEARNVGVRHETVVGVFTDIEKLRDMQKKCARWLNSERMRNAQRLLDMQVSYHVYTVQMNPEHLGELS